MAESHVSERRLGLPGATAVGIGAIVGGGILALSGAAFAATGPSALVAFALNGVIAILTALSFAEVASKFPESGGTYTFSKKVLSVEAAFTVGWVVWFASIVAAVLYALGFGQFAAATIHRLWSVASGEAPQWLLNRWTVCALAIAAITCYSAALCVKSAGGGLWSNVTKVIVFAILIVCGVWQMRSQSTTALATCLQPFFAHGTTGLFTAMGFTFIALQGFDLIAAVAGDVQDPERNIPRAMLGSVSIALAIYLPLLLVICTVGMPPGTSIEAASRDNPETIVAIAAENYLGPAGYWLVMVAGVLSMASALQANLYAASRVALAMARDRTLPRRVAFVHSRRRTPIVAVILTSGIVIVIALLLSDVSAAGAASSLIFLITFALAHWTAILVRQRSADRPPPFRSPLYPVVPVVGGLACLGLAVYQGVAVPAAGQITIGWLALGGLLFMVSFANRARVTDASSAARDPELARLRGRNPLILVPLANPQHARGLVTTAAALVPPQFGRVLLLSVVVAPPKWNPDEDDQPLQRSQRVLAEAMKASVKAGVYPESLSSIAQQPWREIARIARGHRCESVLLGVGQFDESNAAGPLDRLMSQLDCDVVFLRAPDGWALDQVKRILLPTRGRGDHDRLVARLLSSFSRSGKQEINYLKVVPQHTTQDQIASDKRHLKRIATDLWLGQFQVDVVASADPVQSVAERAANNDLVIIGVDRRSRRQKTFGRFAIQLARETTTPLLLVSRRG